MPDLWTTFEPLTDYFILAAFVLPVALGLRWRQRSELLPPQRQRAQPWTGAEVLVAFFIAQFLPLFFISLFSATGVLGLLYPGAPSADELRPLRLGLWATVLSTPLQVWCMLLLLRASSDTRPYQLGWTDHRFRANLLVGLLYWGCVTPAVLLLHLVVSRLYDVVLHAPPDQHSITKLMQETGAPADWVLTVLSAVVAAPLIEETLYRGILQPWLTGRAYRCDLVFGGSLLLALLFREEGLARALTARDSWQVFLELHPTLFVFLLLPLHLWLRNRQPSLVACAIFNAALFFAVWHTTVWPTPVPLLLLGVVLGFLAYRTQSLVSPIVLHAVFNSVAVLTMFHLKA